MVFPSGGDVYNTSFNHHLGAAYIIGYARKQGFIAEQLISNELYNVEECVKAIISYNPKIVGSTVYESNYMQSVLISKILKKNNPSTIIIFGGPTPTVHSENILKDIGSIDLCVRQDGEETVLQLLLALYAVEFQLNRVPLNEIKGITFRDENWVISTLDHNILYSNRMVSNYIDKYPSPYLSNIIPGALFLPGIPLTRLCICLGRLYLVMIHAKI